MTEAIKAVHDEDCSWAISLRCTVSVECEHGYDFCPICDACTCGVHVSRWLESVRADETAQQFDFAKPVVQGDIPND